MEAQKNNRSGFRTLSLAVRDEIKTKFDELYNECEANSKGEFLTMLMDHFTDPVKEKIVEVPVEKVVEKIVEVPVEKIVETPVDKIIEVERPLSDNELIVTLNPVQMFALQRPFTLKGYVKLANKQIQDALKKTSFFSNELKYPDFFTPYDPAGDEKKNMVNILEQTVPPILEQSVPVILE
jgi:hypothetical protein